MRLNKLSKETQGLNYMDDDQFRKLRKLNLGTCANLMINHGNKLVKGTWAKQEQNTENYTKTKLHMKLHPSTRRRAPVP